MSGAASGDLFGAAAASFGLDDPELRALWRERFDAGAPLRAQLRETHHDPALEPFDPRLLTERSPRRDWRERGGSREVQPRAGSMAAEVRAFASGNASARELVQARLDAIERGKALNAFQTTDPEIALSLAAELDRRRARGDATGSLAGATLAVKDIFEQAGKHVGLGTRAIRRPAAPQDAPVVAGLRGAGAIPLGTANMHQLAFGTTNLNPDYGRAINPHVPSAIAGGSSGGSAVAVAAGMASLALGTDTGGSIRIPAGCCGIAGLKPTFGRISTHGIFPLGYSLDHAGPLALDSADVALAFEAMTNGEVPAAWSAWRDLRGVRIGLVRTHFMELLAPEISASLEACARAAESLGAQIETIEIPALRLATAAFDATLRGRGVRAASRHAARAPGASGRRRALAPRDFDVRARFRLRARPAHPQRDQ